MARIVKKFGGTSVADIEKDPKCGPPHQEGSRCRQPGGGGRFGHGRCHESVGRATWIRSASLYDAREYDSVVASGEQVTAGLTAMALQEMGVAARSWLGWQIPIRTRRRAWEGPYRIHRR